jgi:hypothetical protein
MGLSPPSTSTELPEPHIGRVWKFKHLLPPVKLEVKLGRPAYYYAYTQCSTVSAPPAPALKIFDLGVSTLQSCDLGETFSTRVSKRKSAGSY